MFKTSCGTIGISWFFSLTSLQRYNNPDLVFYGKKPASTKRLTTQNDRERAMDKASLQPVRIAVVDDDNMFLEMTRMIVSHDIGDNVISFQSGKAALDHMERQDSASIILSDINMPEVDGFELLAQIKQKYPTKICIMMSGDPDNEMSVKKLGADGYLNKPFAAKELLNLIQSFL